MKTIQVIDSKYLPTRAVGVYQILVTELILERWQVSPVWCGVIWAVIGIATLPTWAVSLRQRGAHPADIERRGGDQ